MAVLGAWQSLSDISAPHLNKHALLRLGSAGQSSGRSRGLPSFPALGSTRLLGNVPSGAPCSMRKFPRVRCL